MYKYSKIIAIVLAALAAWSQTPGVSSEFGVIISPSRAAAEEVRKQLDAGMDFAVLAKEKSSDASAENGGYLGTGPLRPEFQDAAKGLKPGEFSAVIPSGPGFAILTRFRTPPRTRDLDADQIKALAQRGSVLDTIDISGMASANAAFSAYANKPAGWEHDPEKVCEVRTNSYHLAVDRLSQQLPEADAQPPGRVRPIDLLHGHAVLALLFVYSGEMEQSVAEWNKAYRIALASVPDSVPYVEEALGVTYLHWAEMENGVYKKPDAALPFARQENAKLAIQYFSKFLARQPENLEVKWLLTLANSDVSQKEKPGSFRDIAAKLGLDLFTGAGGVVVDDFDNDGLPDVVTSSMDMC